MNETQKRVTDEVKAYLKENGLNLARAAKMLGITRQAAVNVLSVRGFGTLTAMRWAGVFPFNVQFLVSGKGTLLKEAEKEELQKDDVMEAAVRFLINLRPIPNECSLEDYLDVYNFHSVVVNAYANRDYQIMANHLGSVINFVKKMQDILLKQ